MKLTPAKVTLLMLVAVGALIGMYVIKSLFAVEKKVVRTTTVNIPLATAYLAPGTKISDTHVGLGPFPASELKEDTLRSTRVIVGRVVKQAIEPGSPLRGAQLYEPGENSPIVVAAGKQAISITLKGTSEVLDGLFKPGDFVDVHFTLDSQAAGGFDDRIARLGGLSMTLLKGVKVLALNKGFRQTPLLATGNSVVLELAPDQTNVLLVAQPRGTISFTFNPDGEGQEGIALNNADRATLWEILGLRKPARKPDPEEPELPFITETFRGTGGDALRWAKTGKKFDPEAALNKARRANLNSSNSNPDDPAGSGSQADDLFDPDNVFVNPGSRSNDVPRQNAAPSPSSDADIPMTLPGSAGSGVRSRVGSMLRARPKTADTTSGPTALRN
ncbi:MAG: Flp pilus assembly protein CpaB [Planctomycetaceae bacterium]